MAQGKSALNIVRKYVPGIMRVVDATKHLDVTVTSRDCKSATSGAANDCAMARACKREFDGAIVSKAVAYLIKGDTAYRYRVPSSLQREIVSFDRNHDFRPGDYWLQAPHTTEKLSFLRKARQKSGGAKANIKRKTIRRSHQTAGIRSL